MFAIFVGTVMSIGAAFGAEPTYVEDFNFLDRKAWTLEVVQFPFNNELQYYTDRFENVHTACGELVITPLREDFGGREYTSGRLYSNFYWLYGRVEVRAKLPNGFGLWPAIWMLPEFQVYGGWPQSGEIDILEARGQNNDEISSAIHYGGECCSQNMLEASGDLQTQCNNDKYHVYSLDWTPTQLVFRLDGTPFYERRIDRLFEPDYNETGQPFDQHFHLVLNVAVGGDFLDDPTVNTTWNYPDAEMRVDYVKIYSLDDIARFMCAMRVGADPDAVCGALNWACFSQSFADVSAGCTTEMFACCGVPTSCPSSTLFRVATAIFSLYDDQVNDSSSCDFDGNAERRWVLNDGDLGELNHDLQCLVSNDATARGLCDAIRWACLYQSFANVSAECSPWSDLLACCGGDASLCNNTDLRNASQMIFQSYYNQIPLPTSCDFSGNAFLENPVVPIACMDGYGDKRH